MSQLVLSLFPGIGLLDRAFEEEGFTVVRGPDVLWGGDIRRFNPPAGKFDGVIGGPPCQKFSKMKFLTSTKAQDLVPEFVRCVNETKPEWFVMENVVDATAPMPVDYSVQHYDLRDTDCGGATNRKRRFWFGRRTFCTLLKDNTVLLRLQRRPAKTLFPAPTVTGGHGAVMSHERGTMSIEEMCELQGLERRFASAMPFTAHGKRKAIGNGVPLPMGRAIARAVKEATTH